ncbi:MogA/MoaB family molybdenum cofactor biosynthesis protein [Aeromicrobium senzhongii]|uniref:MogA/MoaB family molybdenum cofactor biosynthesis protein n=1 Tax=Aeromicrobium senzhongii TaxID=2663859 RepID=A0ABX6SQP6_9ACTN|nr:MogA/MoaB family molybdenum cofactor biosynthesis protein [Aeromicrobium senzhongii]MTB86767.1 MogA/MoaB family molybdenum cofactor biosynthesis protein [Aeromicrobium senzhongii]QNL93386.1 MogA/MoaB family molybdenum cofactor biosynthesis protein [Aeromicrobium senzhongii]
MTESARRRLGVVVSSTRAADGRREDLTGPRIADWGRAHGFDVTGPHVVPDGPEVEAVLRRLVDERCALVLTTGGTGLTADDHAPEATAAIIDRPAPGIAEAIRARGLLTTPHAALSRGTAGISGTTLVVNLAGSTGAVREGLEVLEGFIDHALEQLGHGRASDRPLHT